MKVWLVSRGEYSSFRIVAAFSIKEKAERFAYVKAFNGDIEEFELDSTKAPDSPMWEVDIVGDGEVVGAFRKERPDNYNGEDKDVCEFSSFNPIRYYVDGRPKRLGDLALSTRVEIESEEGAIKVANERRVQIIAMLGRWPKKEEVCSREFGDYGASNLSWKWGDWSWVEKIKRQETSHA